MGKAVKRLVSRMALALLVLAAAYLGWKSGDAIFPRLETALGIGAVDEPAAEPVTPEAADLAWEKIRSFRASEDALELRLTPVEVSSLLRYSLIGMLPKGVEDPLVDMEGDRIELAARVIPSELPELPDPVGITGAVFPDTVAVSVGGSLMPFGGRRSMLLVRSIVVGGVPIPPGAFPDILAALGRTHEDGLPESAILAPAFSDIGSAYVEAGELVLVRG